LFQRSKRKALIVPSALARQRGAQGWGMALTSLRIRMQVTVYYLTSPSPDFPTSTWKDCGAFSTEVLGS